MKEAPHLIKGGLASDLRGSVSFVNDFNFEGIKRFYMVENASAGIIRAWHGHKKENKFILVVRGEALVGAVKIDNWEKPSKEADVHRFRLSAHQPTVLFIPSGFANGLMSLTDDTQIMIFSTSSLEESKNDDFRFDPRFWDLPYYEDTLLKK